MKFSKKVSRMRRKEAFKAFWEAVMTGTWVLPFTMGLDLLTA